MSDSSALGEVVQKIRKDALFSDRSADTMGLIEKKNQQRARPYSYDNLHCE